MLSIGTTYVLVFAGPMPTGEYQLGIENSVHDPLPSGGTFTVEACDDCDRTIAHQIVADVKASAAVLAESFGGQCEFTNFLETIGGKAVGIRGIKKSLKVPLLNYQSDSGVFVATPGSGFTTITFIDPLSANINKAFDILKHISCGVKQMYADIRDDPPDPEFQDVVDPVYATIGPLAPDALDALVRSAERERGLAEALLHAYEKYQGASAGA